MPRLLLTQLVIQLLLGGSVAATAADFHGWAPTPPMGWNSWDCFGTGITEAQAREHADIMAARLAKHGWEYLVVDIQWYEPEAKGFGYRKDARLVMDGFGRLQPAPNRFPSSADGSGFKPLADYVHAKGLKFGIHMMRGIPRQAVEANLPIQGSAYRAGDIANRASTCSWCSDMYGVDMARPGAQDYYDSIFAMLAGWGLDYVKVDDLSHPYSQAEIEGIRKAIDRTGRRIVFSTSPGDTGTAHGAHINQHANLWRISGDFWDSWDMLRHQFKQLHDWTPYRRPGAYPDADMLPLGTLRVGGTTTVHLGKDTFTGTTTRFTPDEQITLMTLWSIARSPLMHGGDLTRTDDFTWSLLTNDEVLAVNQRSANGRQIVRTAEDRIAWVAEVPGSPDRYLAVFNATTPKPGQPPAEAATLTIPLGDLGLGGLVAVRDLWSHQDLGRVSGSIAAGPVPPHGARLYRLSPGR